MGSTLSTETLEAMETAGMDRAQAEAWPRMAELWNASLRSPQPSRPQILHTTPPPSPGLVHRQRAAGRPQPKAHGVPCPLDMRVVLSMGHSGSHQEELGAFAKDDGIGSEVTSPEDGVLGNKGTTAATV